MLPDKCKNTQWDTDKCEADDDYSTEQWSCIVPFLPCCLILSHQHDSTIIWT